jgi:hypothetical protein
MASPGRINYLAGRLPKILAKERETGWTFTWLLCLPYLAFLVWMHVHHEMWRDEIHAWTLARLARGFSDLVTGDRVYEGHPPLWFWYLHVWTWFVQAAWGVQVATIAAATGAAVLFARFAPFPRYLKVLLLFSYYFGYEYTVLSRNYVLGWLLLCLFCALYHPIRVRTIAVALVLVLLSLTSFYGLAMAMFLLAYFVLDQVSFSLDTRRGSGPVEWSVSASPRLLASVAIVSGGVAFCLLSIEPPDPNPLSPAFNFAAIIPAAVPKMLYRVTAGVLPWRHFSTSQFWATFFTFWEDGSVWPSYVGGALSLLLLLALYPSWRLMLAYAGALATMLVFQQARDEGMPRHWGHFVMFFIAACWLLRTAFPQRRHWLSTAMLTGIVALQLQSSAIATIIDTREVFSGGRDTAAFIRREGLQDLPMVAGPDFSAATVAGYLRRRYFAAETEEVNETVVLHSRRHPFSPHDLMDRAIALARERRSPVLLICNQSLPDPPPGVTRTQLFSSRPGTIADEIFTVYLLQADRS